MKIKRAVKCAAIKKQLEEVLEVAEKASIKGLEIQEIFPPIEDSSFEKRAKPIMEVFRRYPLDSLAYHFPLPPRPFLDDFSKCKYFDLTLEEGKYIFDLTEDTIKEASLLGETLNIKTEIPIIVHLFGVVTPDKITEEEKEKRLERGKKRLLELKETADYYSQKTGLKLVITRENNPPEHGRVQALLDFHPKDTIKTYNLGIGTCLDFAHLWLNKLYWEKGKGEFLGVDLNKSLLPNFDLEEIIKDVTPSLEIIHLNDAGPEYRQPFEGLEIGKGNLPHSLVIPSICSKLKKDIIGTYEIKYGHEDPESMLRSDQFYRVLFGQKFNEYFQ